MEYIIGSVVTLAAVLFAKKYIDSVPKSISIDKSQNSQAAMFATIAPLVGLFEFLPKEKVITQATRHYDSMHIPIVFFEGMAYWILDNVFYMAESEGNVVDKETIQPVDTMTMDTVQLNNMVKIVDMLTKGGSGEISDSRN